MFRLFHARVTLQALVLWIFLMTSPGDAIEVIDLTFDMGSETIPWPGNPTYNFTILNRGYTGAGYWLETNSFQTAEHSGTHIDAPAHFSRGGWRTHEIPASRLVGPAIVVDISNKTVNNVDYRLMVEDLQEWEVTHGQIPNNAIVLVSFGWSSRYPNPALVFNSNDISNPRTFHFPGVHPTVVHWLATHRNSTALGVDTPSTDYAQTQTFETHIALGQRSMLGLENLQNVNALPPRGAVVVIGVLKLKDGSGGPARILALLDHGFESV